MSEEENKEEIVKPKEAAVKPKKTTKAVKPEGEKQQTKVDKEVDSEEKNNLRLRKKPCRRRKLRNLKKRKKVQLIFWVLILNK